MAKNMWQNSRWGENQREDYYGIDNSGKYDYSLLKKVIVAAILFALVYGAHISDTAFGRMVDNEVRYTLAFQSDFNYLLEQIANRAPAVMDLSVLKKVQMAIKKPADPLLYMTKPVKGKMISVFGPRSNPISKQEEMHEGIDFEATIGTNIRAAAAGKVKLVTENAQYGKILIIEHSQDVDTVYGHLGEVLVSQGELISQGQIIAKVGKTGMVSNPLLYFAVREKGKAIDPMPRLKGDFPTAEGK